ncbi:unnamed protein product, partial [Mesorhabditis belari]|uniref:Serpentine receptor class gamma n=1 Tax=Mesorhabditis belari TaxID=2138241 RepID=A0AAF3F2I5_9BILA
MSNQDIVTYLNTYINLKLREIPGIAEYFVNIEYKIPPYRFFIMLSFACYHLQFWKRGAFPLICLLTIYSFAAVWPVPLVNGYYIEVNGVVARSASMYTQLAGLYVYMDYGGKMYIGLAIFFNGATAAKLLYLRFRGQKLSNTQEIGLFVMAFATFFCQIFCQYVITTNNFQTQISTVAAAYVSYSNIISSVNADIFSLSEVYIGLIFNQYLRLHVMQTITGKKGPIMVGTLSAKVSSVIPSNTSRRWEKTERKELSKI